MENNRNFEKHKKNQKSWKYNSFAVVNTFDGFGWAVVGTSDGFGGEVVKTSDGFGGEALCGSVEIKKNWFLAPNTLFLHEQTHVFFSCFSLFL